MARLNIDKHQELSYDYGVREFPWMTKTSRGKRTESGDGGAMGRGERTESGDGRAMGRDDRKVRGREGERESGHGECGPRRREGGEDEGDQCDLGEEDEEEEVEEEEEKEEVEEKEVEEEEQQEEEKKGEQWPHPDTMDDDPRVSEGEGGGRHVLAVATPKVTPTTPKRNYYWCPVQNCGSGPVQKVGQHLSKVHRVSKTAVAHLLTKKVRAPTWAVKERMPNPSHRNPNGALWKHSHPKLQKAPLLQPPPPNRHQPAAAPTPSTTRPITRMESSSGVSLTTFRRTLGGEEVPRLPARFPAASESTCTTSIAR